MAPATMAFLAALVALQISLLAVVWWVLRRNQRRDAEMSMAAEVRELRSQQALTASMSHDLRTPLNSVLTLTQRLGDGSAGPLNESQQRYVDVIQRSGRSLLALLDDLLEQARFGSGPLDVRTQPVDLDAVARAVVASELPLAR